MKDKKNKLGFDDLILYLCVSIMFLGLIYITAECVTNYKVSQEVIKYSEEYTKYDNCTVIQGKYYCK